MTSKSSSWLALVYSSMAYVLLGCWYVPPPLPAVDRLAGSRLSTRQRACDQCAADSDSYGMLWHDYCHGWHGPKRRGWALRSADERSGWLTGGR